MKLINKQIDMISWTTAQGAVNPLRFRMTEDGASIVIKVDRILLTERNRHGGCGFLTFRCMSVIDGAEKVYELTCNCDTQTWLLKKM